MNTAMMKTRARRVKKDWRRMKKKGGRNTGKSCNPTRETSQARGTCRLAKGKSSNPTKGGPNHGAFSFLLCLFYYV